VNFSEYLFQLCGCQEVLGMDRPTVEIPGHSVCKTSLTPLL
jgi:hypothetical protein